MYESLQKCNNDDGDYSSKCKRRKSVDDLFSFAIMMMIIVELFVCNGTCLNLCKTAVVMMMMIMMTPEARWFFAAGLHIHSCCHPSLNRQQN